MSVTDAVRDRVRLDFPESERADIEALLEGCGADFAGEREPLQIAILELSQGDRALVEHYVNASKIDFRDILYWAYTDDDS